MHFAPIPGVKSNGEPNAIPPTSKLSSTSHNDSCPNGSPTSPISLNSSTTSQPPLMPAPLVTQAVAPVAQTSMASITVPTPAPVVNPVALVAALVIAVGGPPDPSPTPTSRIWARRPWLTLTICQLVDLPLPQHHQKGGVHLVHETQLADSTSQT